jgi:hypothetical protein
MQKEPQSLESDESNPHVTVGNDNSATISDNGADGKNLNASAPRDESSSSTNRNIEDQAVSVQDDISLHLEPSSLLIEYIEKSPPATLQALCDSGGICDALFATINEEYDILPGEWWACCSDGAYGEPGDMSQAIIHMLDEKTVKAWRAQPCPNIQKNSQGKVECPMHPIINEGLLKFWSELRRLLRGLYRTPFRSLQALCMREEKTKILESEVGKVLNIPLSYWRGCYASGKGCQLTMATKINRMVNGSMAHLTWETFLSVLD